MKKDYPTCSRLYNCSELIDERVFVCMRLQSDQISKVDLKDDDIIPTNVFVALTMVVLLGRAAWPRGIC